MSQPLSAAAQAVLDALPGAPHLQMVNRAYAAAALRAAADQVVPAGALHLASRGTRYWHRAIRDGEIRLSLHAIAAELDGTNSIEQEN